jgi:thiol peroxidase
MLLVKELRLLVRGMLVIDKAGMVRYEQLVPEVGQEPDYDATPAEITKFL